MSVQSAIPYQGIQQPMGARRRRHAQVVLACLGVAALAGLYLLGGAGRYLALLLGGAVVAGLTLYDTRIGLGIFLLLAGLSPEFSVDAVATVDNLRAEDILFPVLIASWVLRILIRREHATLRTELTVPMVAITFWSVAVTLLGVLQGTVPHGSTALFRLAKYTEYYVIFFVVYNNVRTLHDARALTLTVIVVAVLTALYSVFRGAVAWRDAGDAFARASGPAGENYNTLAGYLVQAFSVAIAMGLSSRGWRWRVPLTVGAVVLAAALLYTHSREGYVMLGAVAAYLAVRRFRSLVIAGIVLALVGPAFLPPTVRQYLHSTVQQLRSAETDDPGSNSMTARMAGWQSRWRYGVSRRPVLGHGIGSVGLGVDNQYLITILETGAVGLALLLWLLVRLWGSLAQAERVLSGTFAGALATGTLGALVGLLVQGTVAASFATIRTMEPWWFLAGLATAAVRSSAPTVPRPVTATGGRASAS